jgi:hypothetical protein
MQLQEKDWILGYWFASDAERNCWYIMMIKRNGEWIGQQTFRYNEEADGEFNPHSGKDRKNIMKIIINGDESEEDVIKKTTLIWNVIKVRFNYFSDMFLVQGSVEKFVSIAKTKDYFHFKEVSKDDFANE